LAASSRKQAPTRRPEAHCTSPLLCFWNVWESPRWRSCLPLRRCCRKWIPSMTPEQDGVRLQKVLARAGVASRRGSEELIAAGRVSVDGEPVEELGTRVDPDTAVIHVDGVRVATRADLVYLALNKPGGVHTTMTDVRGRSCVGDYVQHSGVPAAAGIFHVGRLDADTEGLLLLTNDGELGHRLMHPSYEVRKTYVAEVAGRVPHGLGKRVRAGVELSDGPVVVDA